MIPGFLPGSARMPGAALNLGRKSAVPRPCSRPSQKTTAQQCMRALQACTFAAIHCSKSNVVERRLTQGLFEGWAVLFRCPSVQYFVVFKRLYFLRQTPSCISFFELTVLNVTRQIAIVINSTLCALAGRRKSCRTVSTIQIDH